MTNSIQKAIYKGDLKIGDIEIPCAVLEDGTRVLSEIAVNSTLGSSGGKNYRLRNRQDQGGGPLPLFVASKALKPFIDKNFTIEDLTPIEYLDSDKVKKGYAASILPKVCEIWLKARDAKLLQQQQLAKAEKADMLMRGLAHIGIIALVDEATGYQEIRDKKALAAILDKYLRKELAAWAKRFPDEFYKEMFRLRDWNWSFLKRPAYVGKLTNDVIYERIAPGLLEELKKRSPKNEDGTRKGTLQQLFTDDVGHPALAQHLHAVIGLMRASGNWDGFYRLIQRAFPKKGATLELPLED